MSLEGIPQQTITRIRQLRVNALFGKKKHFNAADRKQCYQDWLGGVVIAINIILGSGLIVLLRAETAEVVKWVGAALSLLAALFAAYQKFFGFQRAISGHRSIAGRYLELSHECQSLLSDFQDSLINAAQLAKRRDGIQRSLSKIDTDALGFSTSGKDYALAQQGLNGGEESYTEAELGVGEGPP